MHNQLLLATLVIVFSVVLQSIMFGVIHHFLDRARNHLIAPLRMPMAVFMLVASALWLVVGIAVSIWTWAGLFYVLSDLPTVETSIYFATVAFTTLGFGDIVLDQQWRLLSGLAAVNGLILFGLTTAFLADIVFQIRALHRP